MDSRLAKTLYRWAKNNEENTVKLEVWLDEAITAIAEGKGSQIMSATGNGISVNLMSNGLTISSWASTLSLAMQYLERNPTSTATAIIV